MKQHEHLAMWTLRVALTCGAVLVMTPGMADPAPSAPSSPPVVASPAPAANAPAASAPTNPSPVTPATAPPKPQSQQVNENSASYVDGYEDGCASANLRYARQAHVKPNRDPKLYDSDNDYHEGWDHGYRRCEDHVTSGALPVMGNSVIQ
jgi:hypothetical protein